METANQQRDELLDAERNARMLTQRATRLKDEFLATLSHGAISWGLKTSS
jgi:hypothetical protein